MTPVCVRRLPDRQAPDKSQPRYTSLLGRRGKQDVSHPALCNNSSLTNLTFSNNLYYTGRVELLLEKGYVPEASLWESTRYYSQGFYF